MFRFVLFFSLLTTSASAHMVPFAFWKKRGPLQTVVITTTGASTWTVPSDWDSNENYVQVIGGGGGGGTNIRGGGGGGAYSRKHNIVLTPGAVVNVYVGAGGAIGGNGQDTYFIDNTTLLAKFGYGTTTLTGGNGGDSAACIGDVVFSGGKGGNGFSKGGGGGGGAGGPTSVGATAANSAGETGGKGGNGGGGGGTGGNGGPDGGPGVAGSAGTNLTGTHGSGGGGGGGGDDGVGGNAGLYGAGGGGGGDGSSGKAGAPGIIVITYASTGL